MGLVFATRPEHGESACSTKTMYTETSPRPVLAVCDVDPRGSELELQSLPGSDEGPEYGEEENEQERVRLKSVMEEIRGHQGAFFLSVTD